MIKIRVWNLFLFLQESLMSLLGVKYTRLIQVCKANPDNIEKGAIVVSGKLLCLNKV